MKVVFFGSPEFAANILDRLIKDGAQIVGVVTQPDKKAGRGRKLRPTPVKQLAIERGIPVFQPESLKGTEIRDLLRGLGADIFVVAAYGLIIPKDILDIPEYGAINVHASLLPKYRGAAPIQWAILNGERVTGITIMQMDEGLDTGPILLQRALAIGIYDTAKDLHDELSELGAELLLEALQKIEHGKIIPISQDESLASYAPKLSKDIGEIDWNNTALCIHNKIRALYPWPMAYFHFNTKKGPIKIQLFPGKLGEKMKEKIEPGTILGIREDFLEVACLDRTYLIPKLKPQSSKVLSAPEFSCGYLHGK